MEKALYACDEVTGLITAVALVRPSRSLLDLEPSSVKKKWKDKAFAAGANRDEIQKAAAEFGIELWEHVGQRDHCHAYNRPRTGTGGKYPKLILSVHYIPFQVNPYENSNSHSPLK